MNNIIQKKITLHLINTFMSTQYKKEGLSDINSEYIKNFCEQLLDQHIDTKELFAKSTLFDRSLNENTFFAGFNAAFNYLLAQIQYLNNVKPYNSDRVEEIDMDIKNTTFFNNIYIC